MRIDRLEKYLLGIHYIGDVPDFVEARVLSYGERLSSLLLTEILKASGVDAEEKLPEDIGLITDGEYRNATVDIGKSEARVRKALKGKAVCVVPGFYGVSEEGRVTLLGCGGSDYTAATVARCIKAYSLDIWKGVGGYMTADPKIVEGARRIGQRSSHTLARRFFIPARSNSFSIRPSRSEFSTSTTPTCVNRRYLKLQAISSSAPRSRRVLLTATSSR